MVALDSMSLSVPLCLVQSFTWNLRRRIFTNGEPHVFSSAECRRSEFTLTHHGDGMNVSSGYTARRDDMIAPAPLCVSVYQHST
jgi:hypothetical protein